MEPRRYGRGPFNDGWPISENSMVHIFGANLKKFLKGDLELVFVRNVPGADIGTVILRTQNGVHNLFNITGVPRSCFVALAENMDLSKVDECHYSASSVITTLPGLD
ncbi:MAG: hypothetical protein HZC14_03590 [Candidatus Niyogibacteria bacterium]|nr:hypothetical protein [Candidatus Niyogibacteria bacterium]